MTTIPVQPPRRLIPTGQPQPGPGSRLDSLTGLRGVAAFTIFLAHLNVFLPIAHTHPVFELGGASVGYFFILSGFVLGWTFTSKDTAGWFYGRRIARIWPLAVLSAVVSVAIALGISQHSDVSQTLWLGGASALLIHAWFQSGILNSPNTVSWPVSVEAFCYALFPLVIRPVLGRTLRQLGYLVAVLVLAGWAIKVSLWVAYPPSAGLTPSAATAMVFGTMSPPARLHEFLLGVVTAAALRKGWRSPVPVSVVIGLLVAAFGVLLYFDDASWRSSTIVDALDPVCMPLIALLIASIATRELSGRRTWLSSRPMVAFGNWSYAFFLFHYLALYLVASAVFHKHTMTAFFFQPPKPSYGNIIWAIVTFAISLVLSGLLHHFYEHPIERRLRKFFRKRFAASGSSA
jgi:peptidoglycan/LPS O-acetylase OafA/YrhL